MVAELVRKRGRPRKEPIDPEIAGASPDPEPKAQKKTPAPPVGKPSKEDIASLIAVPNAILASLPATAPDALTDEEVLRLTDALDAYKRKSEKARTVLNRLVSGSALGSLLIAVVSIAIPRLVRHGLFPAPAAESLERMNEPKRPVPMEREYGPYQPAGIEAFPRPNGVEAL